MVPLTSSFFNLNNYSILYSFTPLFLLYPLAFLGRGYLQGKLLFFLCAVSVLIEPVIKFISAYFFIESNLHSLVYLSIYISAALTGIITFFLVRKSLTNKGKQKKYSFPKAFFAAGLLSGVSTISFLSLDMILVKHFMTPTQAGEYAFLALLGKIVYFLGSLLNIFTISLVTRGNHHKNPAVSFYFLFFAACLLAFYGVLILGVFGPLSIPLIFGEKAISIISYALPYLTAIALFTLGNIIVTYHLARKEYLFPYLSLFFAIILTIGITLYHQTLTQIVYVLITVGFVYSLTIALIHIRQNFFAPKVALKSLQQTQESII
jgi:O-antigen/teichoic acid export membrane protein